MNRRQVVAAATAAAGSVSIAVTMIIRASRVESDPPDVQAWLIAEPLVLAALVFVVIRWSNPRAAAVSGFLAALASALWLQRFLPDEPALTAVTASAAWLLPALALGTIAWYLRWAAAERARAVAVVKSEQRAQLAVDLHDYVAHDISEIVARAQAGTAVLPLGDPRVAELLQQIEAAGLRALESMDQTVHALGEEAGPAHITRGGIDDIDELVRRFAAAGEVGAVVERRFTEPLDAETGAEAYRAVVEALTNVRRHAARATEVKVDVTRADDHLTVSITDDGHGRSGSSAAVTGGLGLKAMTERVERLGGQVQAGPSAPHGWQVSVYLPLAYDTRSGAAR